MHGSRLWGVSIAIAALMLLSLPSPVAAATLTVDGQFDDWAGQPNVTDPTGDGPTPNSDLTAFYWGTNPGESNVYFMFERAPANGRVFFGVIVDTNNDGDFNDAVDRLVVVLYQPRRNGSRVTVWVFDRRGWQISTYGGDWGESRAEGGRRAEIVVSFADLGIDAHQTISMIALSGQQRTLPRVDRAPDTGTITWTPISILGWPWLGAMVAATIGVVWYRRGRYVWRRSSSICWRP